MSKASLKKILKEMDRDQLVELVLEAYDSRKEIKDYFEFWQNPDENEELQKTVQLLFREFFLSNGKNRKRFSRSNINKIVKDFNNICFGEEVRARLLMKLAEFAVVWTNNRTRNNAFREISLRYIDNFESYVISTGQEERFEMSVKKLREIYDKIWWY